MNLINGDCLEELPMLEEDSIDLVATDLPYGTTANDWDSVIPLEPLWEELYRVAKEDAVFVMTASQPFTHELIASNKKDFRYTLVWEKSRGTDWLSANKKPLKSHEDIVLFYRREPTYNPQKTKLNNTYKRSFDYCTGDNINHYGKKETRTGTEEKRGRYPKSVQKFSSTNDDFSGTVHPTQKPVPLFKWLIKSYSDEGDVVLDPAMGSGTTGIAAKKTGRDIIGIEKDGDYYETAKQRINEAEREREKKKQFFELNENNSDK